MEPRRPELARRRLDLELVRRKLAASRAVAQRAIADGHVTVTGVVEPKAATLVEETSEIHLSEGAPTYVSRAGAKLEAALDRLGIEVTGRRAADVGASTGGFTDCLLQHGAGEVVAIDVGYGQLAWSLRTDPRVTVVERTNIRTAEIADLGGPFDVVVADLSFIGLRVVAPQLAALGHQDTDWVLLVKPQFEAGRDAVSAGGVVRDAAVRTGAVVDVAYEFSRLGIGTAGCIASPVAGAKSGNIEYLLWLRHGAPAPDVDAITSVVHADA
jgi:23S rRNA (cytidine1920-2'-O)/16S rRNA (cytidine1409-2'-O)-methyltransferase